MRRQDDEPARQTKRALWAKVLPDHPFGNWATADLMAATTKSTISDWLDRTLAPRNAALIIVGDIDLAAAEAAARSAFGSWSESPGAIEAPPAAVPLAATPTSAALPGGTDAIVKHKAHATQAQLQLVCTLPAADARQAAVYDLAAKVIEDDLWTRLREDTGATYGVHAGASTWRGGTSLISIQADIDNARFGASMSAIRDFWRSARTNALKAKEFARARDEMARARLLGYDLSPSLAAALVNSWNLGWPLTSIDDEAAMIATIRAEEVSGALQGCARSLVLAVTGDEKVVRAALRQSKAAAPVSSAAP
jgi:predicted Zn-dependent peptidase